MKRPKISGGRLRRARYYAPDMHELLVRWLTTRTDEQSAFTADVIELLESIDDQAPFGMRDCPDCGGGARHRPTCPAVTGVSR